MQAYQEPLKFSNASMFLRQLSKWTPTLEGLVSQPRILVPCFCHASNVKDTANYGSVGDRDQLSISLDSQTADGIISTLESNQDLIRGSHIIAALNYLSKQSNPIYGTEEGRHLNERFVPILAQNKSKLSGQQAIVVINMLDQLGFPKHSQVCSALLQHILSCIDELSLKNVCDLYNFIANDAVDSSVRQDLQGALEKTFLVRLSNVIDQDDPEFFDYALRFVNQIQQLSKKSRYTIIVMKKLAVSDDIIPLDTAVSFFIQLNSMKYSQLKVQALLKIQNDLTEQAHMLTRPQLSKMLLKMEEAKEFYRQTSIFDEKLADAIVERVIRGRFEIGFAIGLLSTLCKLRYKSPELVQYCCNQILRIPTAQKRMSFIWTLRRELSITKHKPVFWEEMQDCVLELAPKEKPKNLVHLAAQMMALDWISIPILEKVFDGSYKPELMDTTSRLFCRIYQRLKLDPSYKGPLPTDSQIAALEMLMRKSYYKRQARPFSLLKHLEEGMKDISCIQTDMRTRLFHELDYVVALQKDLTPVKISTNMLPFWLTDTRTDGIKYIEDLRLPPGTKLVIIHTLSEFWFFRNTRELMGDFQMIVDVLELLPYPVIFINHSTWDEMPDDEKTPFIMNAIKAKLESS